MLGYGTADAGAGAAAAPGQSPPLPPSFAQAEAAILRLQGDMLLAAPEQRAAWQQRFTATMPQALALEYLASGEAVRQMEEKQALGCLAVRSGRYYLYRTVTVFGRATDSKGDVDIDLSREGPVQKVSRRQGCITLKPDGTFALCNTGRREVYVNGVLLQQFETVALPHLSLIEMAGAQLLFMVNPVAVNRVQQRSARLVM